MTTDWAKEMVMKGIKGFFVIVSVFVFNVCTACDICGSSGGSFYLTPYGVNKSSVIGCRYSVQHFFSREAESPEEFSKDYYQLIEIYGNTMIGKSFLITGSIPYKMNRQTTNSHPHKTDGLGDLMIQCNYIIPTKSINQVWLGGGVKLPTGSFDPNLEHHPVPSANMEPGTGSVDFILNAADVLKLDNWSIIANARFKINGESKGFQFGNRFSTSLLLSREISLAGKALNVYSGGNFDLLNEDKLKGESLDNGGHFLSGVAGLEIEINKFGVGINGLLPISQILSEDQTKFRYGWMVQIGYKFMN